MSLIKLGLDNIEMGNMMGMDAASVEQAKQTSAKKSIRGRMDWY
jgi:hypothetical protein